MSAPSPFSSSGPSADGHYYVRSPTQPRGYENKPFAARLTYETGISYFTGIVGGGSVGLAHGFLTANGSANTRLKINHILNSAGRSGAYAGNTFGIFAICFSCSRTFIKSRREKTDMYNDIYGIAAAGALTSLPRGFLPAVATGGMLGVLSTGYMLVRDKLKERGI
jgi:import inner membrane translocase subunit TIM23